MSLTAEQIQALMGQTRQKGLYLARLTEFVNSGEGGVCVHDDWATDFSEKSDSTVKQGFENAKNSKNAPEGSAEVRVINSEGKTYLINAAAA